MKLRSLCAVLLVLSSARADPDYYKLEDTQGRVVEARILQFDPKASIVKLKLHNNRVHSVPLSVFTESSQLCIQDWYQSEVVLSNKLIVSINKKSIRSDSYHGERNGWRSHYPGMDYEDFVYDIELYNKQSDPLTNVELEYCIYYEREIEETTCDMELVDNGYIGVNHKQLPRQHTSETITDKIIIPELPIRKRHIVTTNEARLYSGTESEEGLPSSKGHYRTVREKMIGVRIRITILLPSGNNAIKEVSYPTDLIEKTEWPN